MCHKESLHTLRYAERLCGLGQIRYTHLSIYRSKNMCVALPVWFVKPSTNYPSYVSNNYPYVLPLLWTSHSSTAPHGSNAFTSSTLIYVLTNYPNVLSILMYLPLVVAIAAALLPMDLTPSLLPHLRSTPMYAFTLMHCVIPMYNV